MWVQHCPLVPYPVLPEAYIYKIGHAINVCNERHVVLCIPPRSVLGPRRAASHEHLEPQLCQEPVEEAVQLVAPSAHPAFYNLFVKILSERKRIILMAAQCPLSPRCSTRLLGQVGNLSFHRVEVFEGHRSLVAVVESFQCTEICPPRS